MKKEILPPGKRSRGRPKGLGKVPGSGRRKGTPNQTTTEARERIVREADPVGFLIGVMRGHQFDAAAESGNSVRVKVRPTLEQRIDAAKVLARKILPDMKEIENLHEPMMVEHVINLTPREDRHPHVPSGLQPQLQADTQEVSLIDNLINPPPNNRLLPKPTPDEQRNGWTSETLAAFLEEAELATSKRITVSMERKLRWRS